MSTERWIPIPEEVREVYRLWRPTPLYRATRLEKMLKTPAHIYYKYEGVSPPGSHKPNTAVAQAYYNVKQDTEQLTTETGEEKTLLFLLCGHGHFDMKAYDDFIQGKLPPYQYPKEKIKESMDRLKKLYPQINK